MKKNQRLLMGDVCHFFSVAFKKRSLNTGFIALVILLSPIFSKGQTVKELGSLISEMKQSGDVSVQAQGARLKSLSFDLNPTVYLDNRGTKVLGENPVCAVVTGGALNKLYEENPLFRQVELIKIKIDNLADLSGVINLSSLSGFPNLKYIQILCEVNCKATQIDAMLSGSKANVMVCYMVSLPG